MSEKTEHWRVHKVGGRTLIMVGSVVIAEMAQAAPESDATRIVACVNACAGIDTAFLTAWVYGVANGTDGCPWHDRIDAMLTELYSVKQQRDELLGMLGVARHWHGPTGRLACENSLNSAYAHPLWPNKHNGSKLPLWDAIDASIAKAGVQ